MSRFLMGEQKRFLLKTAAFLAAVLCVIAWPKADAKAATAENWEIAKERLGAAWKNMEKECDLSGLEIETTELSRLYTEALYEFPECFYVNISFRYQPIPKLIVKPGYNMTKAAVIQRTAQIEKETAAALAPVQESWSDMEKALYVHDYLATHVSYDSTYTGRFLDDALIEKNCVCQGYCNAAKYMLNRLGVTCEVVWSNELNHAWNMVCINGDNYYMDITQDDPSIDTLGQSCHEFFLKSAKYLYKDKNHRNTGDWCVTGIETSPAAKSAKYDKCVWDNVRSRFVYLNGYWYASTQDGYVCRFSCDGKKMKKVKKMCAVKEKWGTHENGERKNLVLKFIMVASYRNQLYYSTPHTVCRLNLRSGKSTEVFRFTEQKQKNGWNYGMDIGEDGRISCQYSEVSGQRGAITKTASIRNYTTFSKVKNTKKGIRLQWERSPEADGYCIYRKGKKGGFKLYKTIKRNSTVSFVDKKTKKKKGEFSYRIASYVKKNGKKKLSTKSPIFTVKRS